MNVMNLGTKRAVTAGLVLALGVLAPVGVASADQEAPDEPIVAPQSASHVYVNTAGAGEPDTYTTVQEALQNVSDDGIIELASDVTMDQGLYVEKDVSLNLAGHSLVGPTNAAYSHAAIQVSEGHSLTIDGGGTVTGRHEHAIIAIGSVTLGDCTINRDCEGSYPAIMVTGSAGAAVIDGATIVNTNGPAVKLITDGCTLGVLDGYLEGSSEYGDVIAPEGASVSVSGGIFSQPVKGAWCTEGYLPRMVTYDVADDGYTVGAATARPTAVNRTFTGAEQFGADASEGYTLSAGARDAGTHVSYASPADGYAWEESLDGESDALVAQLEGGDSESRKNTAPVELTWTMSPASMGDVVFVAIPDQTYTGSVIEPAVTATLDGNALTAGTDYELTYADNVELGTATVTVKGKGNLEGSTELTFKIVAAPAETPTDASTDATGTTGTAASSGTSSTTAATSSAADKSQLPQTGDAGAVAALSQLAIAGLGAVFAGRKMRR